MSKIVTMTAEVPWVSAQKFSATLEKVMPMVVGNNKRAFEIQTVDSATVRVHSPEMFGCIGFYKEPSTGHVRSEYDSINSRFGEKLLNEVIVEAVREKALRNNYRVTVERHSQKTTLLLER